MIAEARTRSYFEQLSEKYQRESAAFALNLESVQPLVVVWGLALDDGRPHIIDLAEEGVALELKRIWGLEAEVRFNRDKRAMLCRHQEGLEKVFRVDRLQLAREKGMEK